MHVSLIHLLAPKRCGEIWTSLGVRVRKGIREEEETHDVGIVDLRKDVPSSEWPPALAPTPGTL